MRAFVLTFVLLCAVTVAGIELSPDLRDRVSNISVAYRPPDAEHYLAHDRGGHVDHHILYFGTDADSVRNLQQADVLLLGNSRLMFAMQARVLQPFFAERGLSYFVLGFGFNEADAFPLAIIERLRLTPRLVVVNVDGFFGEGLSAWAQQVVRDSPFAARKRQWEAESAHEARRVVHQLLPNWLDLVGRPGFAYAREFIAYRSRADGTWFVSPWPEGTELVTPTPLDMPRLGRREAEAATRFAASLAARGSRLVLTAVPATHRSGGGPAEFSRLLDVPLIAPAVAALTTHDGSHLTQNSALEWARAFVDGLEPHLTTIAAGSR